MLQWPSTAGRRYVVERSDSLVVGFTDLTDPLPATPPRNIYTDTTVTGPGPYFYRIRRE